MAVDSELVGGEEGRSGTAWLSGDGGEGRGGEDLCWTFGLAREEGLTLIFRREML